MINSFLLAMVTFPGVQEKAQRALDDVLGCQRLAEYDDQVKLPYVQALLLEVLR